jgi:hypothetical protein
MDKPTKSPVLGSDKALKRSGLAGIGLGGAALVACELPIILTVIGLGGLSAGAVAFRPPAVVELVAIVLAGLGVAALGAWIARRIIRKRRQEQS